MTVAVKICGLSEARSLDVAIDAGAAFVGFVFFDRSPRNVTVEAAAELAERARGRSRIVALTVDPSDADLERIVEAVRPDVIQLHGRETLTRVAEIKARYGLEVWKAIPVADADDVAGAEPFAVVADLVLFDAKPPVDATLPGGNGRTFDWSLLESVADSRPFVLSGGLDADNVTAAIAAVRPAVVDVSSGVERAPGVKDELAIRRFVAAVREAG